MNIKELSYLVFALLASSCGGYGAMVLTAAMTGGFEGMLGLAIGVVVGVVVGFGSLALMIRGIATIRAVRIRKIFSPRA